MNPHPQAPRLAVIRSGDRPRLNARFPELLGSVFPDHEIDDIDVFNGLRARPAASAVNMLQSGWEYRTDLARRRIRPKRAYVTSRSFARHVERSVDAVVAPSTHRFTFQSQSLWNAARPGLPNFVYTDHTRLTGLALDGGDPHGGTGGRFLERERRIYTDARTIFVRSRHVADTLEDGYGCAPEKVEVVGMGPNGSVPDEERTGSPERRRLLFVGIDWERKGGPMLLDAFDALAPEFPGLELEVVGPDADVGDRPGITVHGRIPLDEVYRLQQRCDIFCLPTLFEPFGVAFIEAMHASLPVVGPDTGAVPDLVRDGVTGILHQRGDTGSLVNALRPLLANPDRAVSMGRAGREHARTHYDWAAVMQRIHDRIDAELP